jgi:tetratricopeptide (TPR) repeat protein
LGDTAEHFERAGQIENACEFFTRAAAQAKARYAHGTALEYSERALALLGEANDPEHRAISWRLHDVRERSLQTLGRRPEQRVELEALEQIAEILDDDERRAELRIRQSILGMRMADWRSQEDCAREAMVLAEKLGKPEIKLDAKRLLASALIDQGQIEEGKALALAGLNEARTLGLKRSESLMLNTLAIVAFVSGDVAAGLEWNQHSLHISRETKDLQAEAIDLANCGGTWLDLGSFERAGLDLREALRLSRAVGARQAESSILSNLSRLAWHQGQNNQALADAQAALDIAVAMQSKDGELLYLWNRGNAELALSHHEEAAQSFSRSRELARSIESPWQFDGTAGLARLALEVGDRSAALSHVESLLEHFANGGTLEGAEAPRLVMFTCYRALRIVGDPRAREILFAAHRELMERAASITEPSLRGSFLNNVTEHREIIAAWLAEGNARTSPCL